MLQKLFISDNADLWIFLFIKESWNNLVNGFKIDDNNNDNNECFLNSKSEY